MEHNKKWLQWLFADAETEAGLDRLRAKIYLGMSMLVSCQMVLWLAYYHFGEGSSTVFWFLFFITIGFLASALLYRMTPLKGVAVHMSLGLMALVLSGSYMTMGENGWVSVPWIGIVPFIAYLVSGLRATLVWSMVVGAFLSWSYFAERLYVPPMHEGAPTHLYFMTNIAFLLTSMVIVGIYDVVFGQILESEKERGQEAQAVADELQDTLDELTLSRVNLEAVLESLDGHIFMVDLEGRLLFFNQSLDQALGRILQGNLEPGVKLEHLLRGPIQEIWRARMQDYVLPGVAYEEELPIDLGERGVRWYGASGRPVRVHGELVGAVISARDITSEKEMQLQEQKLRDQMNQVRKLESLGVMAGGIAHDFNNLLVGILGGIEGTQDSLEEGDIGQALRDLELAQSAGRRAADLTRNLLTYSGKRHTEKSPVEIDALVREMVQLVYGNRGHAVEIVLDLRADAWVRGDASQLEQVVLNLLLNAVDSMEGRGGTIQVQTALIQADRQLLSRSATHESLPLGEYVSIDICDRGVGMGEETRERVFEPFFSSKFQGKGLGLASVLGILRAHEGAILVESEPGEGTVFSVLLPLHSRDPMSGEEPSGTTDFFLAEGTILVCDDEPVVREQLEGTLTRLGFDVLMAHDGTEGIALFDEHQDDLELVFLDWIMPNRSGEEVFEHIRESRESFPVFVMSGYTVENIGGMIQSDPHTEFLSKPFTSRTLRKLLKNFQKSRSSETGE